MLRWGFNTQSHGWTQYDVSLAASQRPSGGASAEAPDLGMAFYLNGMISNLSSANTANANTPPTILEGLIALDLKKQAVRSPPGDAVLTGTNIIPPKATNISTNGLGDGSPRVRGGMVYIPQIGQKGVLVTVGGTTGSQESPRLGNAATPHALAVTFLTET